MIVLKIVHVNIRSLLANFVAFKDFVYAHNYDIICLSETWLSDAVSDNTVMLNNYNLFRHDRQNKVGGGVAIYAKI